MHGHRDNEHQANQGIISKTMPDVEWDLVIATVLSPTKTHPNKRLGKDRFTYVKKFKKFVIEVHTKNDAVENKIWVINAFKTQR
jgi:hypothetical protein